MPQHPVRVTPTLWQRARLLLPMMRLSRRVRRSRDWWERMPHDVPPCVFGPGSLRPWTYYFEGGSDVAVTSADDVAAWLLACTYATDAQQFGRTDHWQHPRQLERRRTGDCEDLSLWAWRKLAELGHEAELHCGWWMSPERGAEAHAWVVYRDGGETVLMECTARSDAEMRRPLPEVRAQYMPRVAVDHRFQGYLFGGLFAAR